MPKDSKYVSQEKHEINTIAVKFGAPAPLLYFIINEMEANKKGHVLRTDLYSIIKTMGYVQSK